MKKVILFALVLSLTGAAYAGQATRKPSSLPKICTDANNPKEAFLKNVLAAVRAAKIRGATEDSVKQTVFDNHDPEYDVTVNGKTVHVACDDSGDGDCACSVAGQ